jgi:hypothetical protein
MATGSPASLAVLALLCGAWVLYRLLGREESPELQRVEWLFPLRGRWLRYALAALLALALAACAQQLALPPPTGFLSPAGAGVTTVR